MINIICDACKKSIPSPSRGSNYTTLLNKDLCNDCHAKMEDNISAAVAKYPEFHVREYQETRTNILMRMTR